MSRKKVWMPQMDDIIRQNSDKTDLELVTLLGGVVTENAVRKRRQSLGIRHKRGRRTKQVENAFVQSTTNSDNQDVL